MNMPSTNIVFSTVPSVCNESTDGNHPEPPSEASGDGAGRALEKIAHQLAATHKTVGKGTAKQNLQQRLRDIDNWLHEAHRHFATADADASSRSPAPAYAAEWILDNFYVIEQALRQIKEDLPETYYSQLPKVTSRSGQADSVPLVGLPRVYALTHAFLHHETYQVEPERLQRFVAAYQQVTSLTMGEVWALPIMLRLALLEALAQAAGQVVHLEMQSAASLLPTAANLSNDEVVEQTIPSLRALDSQDWKAFFEAVNLVHQALCRDPAQVYAKMDFATRDHYRNEIEALAAGTGVDERQVAAEVLQLARAATQQHTQRNGYSQTYSQTATHNEQETLPRDCHVGYYIVDAGRAELEAAINYRPRGLNLFRRQLLRHPTVIYLGGIALFTLLLMAVAFWYAIAAGSGPLLLLLIALLTLIPTSTIAINALNSILTRLIPPRVLPKLDFRKGIPADCHTMVVVPALISSQNDVESLCRQLELHYLRSTDETKPSQQAESAAHTPLTFALLTDFSDAPEEVMPEDDALLTAAITAIETLNANYPNHPFYLFHRRRLWNESEDVWMGWERKRGKLHELNCLLLDKGNTTYTTQIGDLDRLTQVRYVITLDADTVIPRGETQRLIGTLAHPLNRAEFNEKEKVIAGYTILQPRTEIKPTSSNQSLFARVFGGDTGFDLYTLAVSDIYQDLFGEGIFVGKGIYDVEAFERSLAGRVPENSILSHDLFEGIHGRAGLVTDVVLYEEYPSHYLVNVLRSHRWVRGDWQLLPWLFPRVPAAEEGGQHLTTTGQAKVNQIPNDLSVIDRWKIFDNLRRSLFSPLLLAFLIAAWTILPGAAWVWTLLAILAPSVPVLMAGLSTLGRLFHGDSPQSVGYAIRNPALRWLLFIAFLPYESLLLLDAIATTLVRLYIRRRRLLRWVTAARTVRLFGDETTAATTFAKMLPVQLFVVALFALLLLTNPIAIPVAAPFLAVWLLAWWIAHRISLPVESESTPLSAEQTQAMRALARRTWLFYEHFVGPDDHWLPPDHFQEVPRGVVAHRTSPTNVGMYLLSALAAYDLGYIGAMDLASRFESTFTTLAQLERYRGHFLNWINTRTLEPLPPRYISMVDSGNLAGTLIALRQGLLTVSEQPIWRWERWQGLLDLLVLLRTAIHEMMDKDETELHVPESHENALMRYLDQVAEQIGAVRDEPTRWHPLLQQLGEEVRPTINQHFVAMIEAKASKEQDGGTLDPDALHTCRVYNERIHHHLEAMQRSMIRLLPWLPSFAAPPELLQREMAQPALREAWQALQKLLPVPPTLSELVTNGETASQSITTMLDALDADHAENGSVDEARNWCRALQELLAKSIDHARQLQERFAQLAQKADQIVNEMAFGFLFDEERQIFHIGYNMDIGELDKNYYDLLASEARIGSLVAIAKRDVPQSHWLHLSRPVTQTKHGERVLLSWSGTMFEYLMPPLLLRGYRDTLLDQSCRAAVSQQIAVGGQQQRPWGISESGFYLFDAAMNYQYQAFGAPGLGFKRGLEEHQVVTPYASLLAIAYDPQAVWQNVQALEKFEMMGQYGLYEAIDFTPSRLRLGEKHARVQSYMAHHQGMILLALLNYLHDNCMVERFHADPRIQSTELLLQEGVPTHAPIQFPHAEDGRQLTVEEAVEPIHPWRVPVETPLPLVHFLSNGKYSLLINNSGGGYSRRRQLQLTRWRADTTLDDWGCWLYLQELDGAGEQAIWSATRQPTGVRPAYEEVTFHPHKAEFRRRDRGITLHTEVTIAPDDNVEIRRLTLTNDTERVRHLRLTSYGEVVLGPGAADERHQAFAKLFVESDYLAASNTLLFYRRPRAATEQTHFLAHSLLLASGQTVTGAHESDRARFIGRGRTARQPRALCCHDEWLSGTTGATLDPIMALGQEITLEPHTTTQVAFLTATADTREETLTLIERYRGWGALDRAFQSARNLTHAELRSLGLTESRLEAVQQLLSLLLYPHAARRAAPEVLAANLKGQSGLWAYGISGDYPLLLVRIHDEKEGSLLQGVLQAHRYWRRRGLQIDVVILNRQGTNYGQPVQSFVQRLISRAKSNQWLNRRGGLFVLREDQLGEADLILLHTTARVVLDSTAGTLAEQLAGILAQPTRLPLFEPTIEHAAVGVVQDDREEDATAAAMAIRRPDNLQFDNGIGGFSPDGKEYQIYLRPGDTTPAPWINVIANADFGTLVSETGGGYTWAINSGENRLTTWRNDPVSDQPAEVLYLRDEQSAELWTPTPQPTPANAPYLIRHGAGYTIFEHHSHGLQQAVHISVAPDVPVKIVHLRLENRTTQARRLTATYYAEWVLGVNRSQSGQYIVPEYEQEICALLARNSYSADFDERVAFVAGSREPHGVTTDRAEFLGRLGSLAQPAALQRIGLSGRVRAGLDPCAALQLHVDLPPGGTEELYFLIGQGADRAEAIALVERFQEEDTVAKVWQRIRTTWDGILGQITVETPEPALDLLLNRWLLYQALACRIWGRSALYQSSGAYGYRDQLQDSMALIHSRPDLVREQILRAARHQFAAGDVLHWWHPPRGQGVRTRITDDLLWLPYVTAHYVAATGDETILQERVPFLQGESLADDEEERYAQYGATEEVFSIYEHCLRALKQGTTAGSHGIPLMGAGDWNDGMNRVGIEGKGESIWLGWFLHATQANFAALCDQIGETETASHWRAEAKRIRDALEEHGWDGDWYRRAYYDDGTPLGSAQSRECRIDSIAQSWAVISGAANAERAQRAMLSVRERLVRWEDRLILLFTPPFDKTNKDPGYIKGYLPGIRENGGQYTHAALWAIWAFAELGDGDTAGQLFQLINPILRADSHEKAERYKVEPYVIAADVYGVAPHEGRGGWTWYTGSSGWMYRLGIEAILGVRRVEDGLRLQPRIPSSWPGFQVTYRFGESRYEIFVERDPAIKPGDVQLTLDDRESADDVIPLHDDGQTHRVQMRIAG